MGTPHLHGPEQVETEAGKVEVTHVVPPAERVTGLLLDWNLMKNTQKMIRPPPKTQSVILLNYWKKRLQAFIN